ncbi:MAG: hypothetical protein HYU51_08515 [Candidatus Rokubacteria bacterium]|nr:hypothetical protein [Candidatus Rokubacteria bacterium]
MAGPRAERPGFDRTAITCVLAILVLTLSGCAAYAWMKPGAAPDVAEADLLDCDRQARSTSWDIETSFWRSPWGWYGPWPGPWAWHGPLAWRSPFWRRSHWHDPFWMQPDPFWRVDLERRLVERCMHAKGYDLQKVEEPDGGS